MSYCRNNGTDSDVYVIGTGGEDGDVLQCFCGSRDQEGFYEQAFPVFATRSGMIAHLREHQEKGDRVPGYAFERLEREIQDEGDEI